MTETSKPTKRRKKELANVSSGEVVDLGRLKLPTLKRYKQTHESHFLQFNAQDSLKGNARYELIDAINTHFRNTPVPAEKETKLFFLYLAHQQRVKDGIKAEIKEEPKP